MITLAEYFMGREREHAAELTEELRINAGRIVARANLLLSRAGLQRRVTSGWRPAAVNATVENAAKESKHIVCLAVDIEDGDGTLDAWCMAHPRALEEIGLWLEHPSATPRWCHVQTVPPKSGSRVFHP